MADFIDKIALDEELEISYWAVIPGDVLWDERLPANAKLLYAEISALAKKSGYCYASNGRLAKLFGMNLKSIQRLVGLLADRGHIRVDVIRDPKTNAVEQRRIYVGVNPAAADAIPGVIQSEDPHRENTVTSPQNCGDPHHENAATSPQNCSANMIDKKDEREKKDMPPLPPAEKGEKYLPAKLLARVREYAGADGALLEALLAFAENRAKAAGTPIKTDRALTLLLNKLDRLSGGDAALKVALLDKAIEHNWQSVYALRADELPGARASPGAHQGEILSPEVETW